MAIPTDLALTLAGIGIPINAGDEQLESAIRQAIAERRGYFDGPEITDSGYRVELLFPERQTFEGRTPALALAWCLVYLLGSTGEVGAAGFKL